ncbi:hypothetical protein D3C87_1120910 [compost metagenome]
MAGDGWSWMLSGISQLSSAPPWPSKNDQVLRASTLRNWFWSRDKSIRASTGGRLKRQAMAGIATQSARTGKAATQADGFSSITPVPMAVASTGEPETESRNGPERVPPSRLVMLDGFHSSSRRREIVSRYSVLMTASRLYKAS